MRGVVQTLRDRDGEVVVHLEVVEADLLRDEREDAEDLEAELMAEVRRADLRPRVCVEAERRRFLLERSGERGPRRTLGDALRRVLNAGIPLEGASDHGVSEAIYLRDPDGNGVELYRDRPEAEWPREGDGTLAMTTRRLDLQALLAEAP